MHNSRFTRSDKEANTSFKGRLVVKLFRLAHVVRMGNKFVQMIGLPYLVFYRLWVEWMMGIEIPPLTQIGSGLALHHGQGLVLNNKAVIGAGCTLRHGVTIGNRGSSEACPVLQDGVDVGANALILGGITIGEGAMIGAGAVVTKDVPAGGVMVGNPAKNILSSIGK